MNLTPVTAAINGEITALPEFEAKMKALLSSKTKPEQRLVVVKSSKDTPYHRWIRVTSHPNRHRRPIRSSPGSPSFRFLAKLTIAFKPS